MGKKSINIDEFKGFEAKIDLTTIIEEHGKEAVEELRSINNWKTRRKSKSYSAGWVLDLHESKGKTTGEVWNKTSWQLTWLLENGHLIVNKKGGVGWAAPHKHIKPVFDKQSDRLLKDIKNIEIDFDFE